MKKILLITFLMSISGISFAAGGGCGGVVITVMPTYCHGNSYYDCSIRENRAAAAAYIQATYGVTDSSGVPAKADYTSSSNAATSSATDFGTAVTGGMAR